MLLLWICGRFVTLVSPTVALSPLPVFEAARGGAAQGVERADPRARATSPRAPIVDKVWLAVGTAL